MLHIRLGDHRPVNPAVDDLGRHHVGFREGMSDAELYEANHGCWRLGERAHDEQYAIFSFDGVVRQAVEITSISRAPKRSVRSIVHGRILTKGDLVHDTYVGRPAPDSRGRNPVSYVPDGAAREIEQARMFHVGPDGADFGDPETHQEVEIAAMSVVSGEYAVAGWIIEDVSALKCGWDLTVTKGRRVRHLEVKGVSGPLPKILVTRNELRVAAQDLDWFLVVVTDALTSPTSREYGPAEVHRLATPLAYEVDLRSL